MIDIKLETKKNLLAFSAGVDSSALFFLLLKNNIPFDIAIVDYNLREQSKEEVEYAKELARAYGKKIYLLDTKLKSKSNLEAEARNIRYDFFENIIKKYNYETLLTAHQLNDKLEWFLMQMTKGAGVVELLGLKERDKRKNYEIFRPLLEVSKNDLENFLIDNNFKYFIDQSNLTEDYTRNKFRHNYSNDLLNNFEKGIKDSFKYMENDLKSLKINEEPILEFENLIIFEKKEDNNINIRVIDKTLKKLGFLISGSTREEILKNKETVISHKICISFNEKYIFISPYEQEHSIEKKFKDKYRIKKIPNKIRKYLDKLGNKKEILDLL